MSQAAALFACKMKESATVFQNGNVFDEFMQIPVKRVDAVPFDDHDIEIIRFEVAVDLIGGSLIPGIEIFGIIDTHFFKGSVSEIVSQSDASAVE
ncbi:hypothetical protein D1872_274710 [compost metagenome]